MSERIDPATLPAAPPGMARRWFAVGRDGLSGRPHVFTQGSLQRAIALLEIPMVLELALESLVAVLDLLIVCRLGADAVAQGVFNQWRSG
jgi:hypothetical protein